MERRVCARAGEAAEAKDRATRRVFIGPVNHARAEKGHPLERLRPRRALVGARPRGRVRSKPCPYIPRWPMHVSVFVGMSLDGFIARPDGRFDFLKGAEGGPHGYQEFMATVDALLIGRGTYEVVLRMGGWFYGNKPVFVLSTKPLAPAPKEAIVERMSGEPREVAKQLDARGAKHVYVDGGLTVQQ